VLDASGPSCRAAQDAGRVFGDGFEP
jgi:hypothetical protein